MSKFERIIIGSILGAIPGAVLLVLTIPISGEVELTLGVLGIFLGLIGFIIGAIIGGIST